MENNVDILGPEEFRLKQIEVKKYSDKDPYKILIPSWLGKKLKDKKLEVTIRVVEE